MLSSLCCCCCCSSDRVVWHTHSMPHHTIPYHTKDHCIMYDISEKINMFQFNSIQFDCSRSRRFVVVFFRSEKKTQRKKVKETKLKIFTLKMVQESMCALCACAYSWILPGAMPQYYFILLTVLSFHSFIRFFRASEPNTSRIFLMNNKQNL